MLCSTLAPISPSADPATCIVFLQASNASSLAHLTPRHLQNHTWSELLEISANSLIFPIALIARLILTPEMENDQQQVSAQAEAKSGVKSCVWSCSSFVTDCKGVAVAAQRPFYCTSTIAAP